MNHTRFADWVTIWVVHLLEQTERGGPNYQTVLSVHSCSSWFCLTFDPIFIIGSKLTRLIYNNMTYNREEGSLNIDLAIPEAGFEYIGRLRLPSNPGSGIDLMDFIWMSGKPYFGYFIKVSAQELEVSFLSHVWFLSQLL